MTLHRRDGNHIWYSRELHRTLYGCTCVREKTYDLFILLKKSEFLTSLCGILEKYSHLSCK